MSFSPTRPFSLPGLPPNALDLNDPEIRDALLAARVSLAELKGYSPSMPNPMLLMTSSMAQESMASSEIEAIHTTLRDVFQGDLFPDPERRGPDKEVLYYRDAMLWSFDKLKTLPISTRLILGIHSKILKGRDDAGAFRKQQNGIANDRTGELLYTPPIATNIPGMLSNWEKFVNDQGSKIDPLLRCALAHYQFEAIHPFGDGNGRTGRILMILQLIQDELLHYPVLYISGYLNRNRADYYAHLRDVSKIGDWKGYLIFMLKAFELQARETRTTLFKIMSLFESTKERFKSESPKIYDAELVAHIFSKPITNPAQLSGAHKIHHVTASKYLREMKKLGILKDQVVGKYRFYINAKLLDLLKG